MIPPTTFGQFLSDWRQELTDEVLRRLPPVYRFEPNPTWAGIAAGLRRPPFPAQFHAAAALATYLRDHRAALAVGEPSVGKTMTALTTAALLSASRVLVLAPAHLLGKWTREIRETIPHVHVIELRRVAGVDRAIAIPARPSSPVFYLVSRDLAKLGAPWRSVAQPWYLLPAAPTPYVEASRGYAPTCRVCHAPMPAGFVPSVTRCCPNCVDLPRRVPIRPGTEHRSDLLRDDEGVLIIAYSCPTCGQLLRDEPTEKQRTVGEKRRLWTTEDLAGRRGCPSCGDILVQPERLASGRGLFPLARYLARRYRNVVDLLILDEVHQLKGHGTSQGMMLSELTKVARRTIALTATLMSGKASSLFFLLHRLFPEFRTAWSYSDVGRFVRTYGLTEVTREEFEQLVTDSTGKQTKRKSIKQTSRELPGVSPAILQHVLDRTVFLHLSDLGLQLPSYQERAVELEMTPEQQRHYDQFLAALRGDIAVHYKARRLRVLASYLQALLSWPDAPWRGDAVSDPRTGTVLATIPALEASCIYPKEQALVELCQREAASGRKVLVYCTHTQTRDITGRLRRILSDAGLRAEVLKASVSTRRREAWVHQHAHGLDALVTSPRLVGEGLDLIEFPTIVWMEPEYSTYTVRQSSRRSWRITQNQPVTVYFFVYGRTLQRQALAVVATGIRAASMVDGEVADEDSLAGFGAQGEFFMELARLVSDGTNVKDLSALLADAAAAASDEHAFIGATLPAADALIRPIAITRPTVEQTSLF